MLDRIRDSVLGRLKAKAVPMEDWGLAPISEGRELLTDCLAVTVRLTILPEMIFLLPPHHQALGPLLQSLDEDRLRDLEGRGVCLPQLDVNSGIVLVTDICVWLQVSPWEHVTGHGTVQIGVS